MCYEVMIQILCDGSQRLGKVRIACIDMHQDILKEEGSLLANLFHQALRLAV